MKRVSKEEYLQRLGSSFAQKSPEGSSAPSSADPLQPVYTYVGRQILKFLSQRENQTGSLFELLEPLDTRVEELMPVVLWLEQQGYIVMVEKPRNGDWRFKATDTAKKLR